MVKRIVLLAALFALSLPMQIHARGERVIVNDKTTVSEKAYVYFPFDVSQNNSDVKGRFHAEGGSGNDIEVLILDSDGFENWRNGHKVRSYYYSGRVTVANVYARLPRGRFYLIFNNTFSLLSNKVVTASIRLSD